MTKPRRRGQGLTPGVLLTARGTDCGAATRSSSYKRWRVAITSRPASEEDFLFDKLKYLSEKEKTALSDQWRCSFRGRVRFSCSRVAQSLAKNAPLAEL